MDRWKVAAPIFTGRPQHGPDSSKTIAEIKQDVTEIRGRLEALRADYSDKRVINGAIKQCLEFLDALNKLD